MGRVINWLLGRKYFISFIEEFYPHQKPGTWMGRAEYYNGTDDEYGDELSIGSFDREGVLELRGKYDWKHITEKEFKKLQKEIDRLNAVEEK